MLNAPVDKYVNINFLSTFFQSFHFFFLSLMFPLYDKSLLCHSIGMLGFEKVFIYWLNSLEVNNFVLYCTVLLRSLVNYVYYHLSGWNFMLTLTAANTTIAESVAQDQPTHHLSLFYRESDNVTPRSDCMDAQAGPELHCPHMTFCLVL